MIKKYTIADYLLAEYNRTGSSADNIYLLSGEVCYKFLFSESADGRASYPTCLQNEENLITVTNIIMKRYPNKRLFYGTLYNGVLETGQDNRAYEIIRSLVDSALMENKYKIDTLYNTTTLDYNPIENYNRTQTTTITHEGSEVDTKSGSEEKAHGGSDTLAYTGGTTSTPTGSTTNIHSTTAFNEPSDFAEDTKDVTTYDGMQTTETFNDRKDTNQYNSNETVTYNDVKNEHTFANRVDTTEDSTSGNIGVTTSQQMLESEREVAEFSVFAVIADIVQESFCTDEWVLTPLYSEEGYYEY